MTEHDLCSIVRSWPLCAADGDEHVIVTHCQLPNGGLVKVRVRRSGDGWVVSDGGAAVDDAFASGIEKPNFGLGVRRAIRGRGLTFVDGRIETPRVAGESLFNAVVAVANAARDIADTLIGLGNARPENSLETRVRERLVRRFQNWVSARPAFIKGASERQHKFRTALDLPDGRKVLIDVVSHHSSSINSSIVANLDVRRLQNSRLIQRIVFDPKENWRNEDLELLSVGATPVALPSLEDDVVKLAS